ncbi:AAA family ATPase [Streptomyces sp. NPDC048581]|uniref:AAA family ATPase n=1 Tax=unclassified Streptomyces TaxID=2593676 RepID=UPI00371FA427
MAAIHQEADAALPLGSGVLIDTRRVLTCAHVVYDGGQVRDGLWVAFPKADELMFERLRVVEVHAPLPELHEVQDVAVLVLEDEVAAKHAAPLHNPSPRALVDSAWWSFGFPDSVLGDSAEGEVGEALALGWVRLTTTSPSLVQPGYSGAALWSAKYEAVVGLVGQARQGSGDARALTLKAVNRWLPQAHLERLPGWSQETVSDGAGVQWAWTLAGDAESVRHWRPRARGVSTDAEQGFRFRGRHAALTTVVDWITAAGADRRQVLLVTGSPGVGKSAVLSRVVTTADAEIAAWLPDDDTAVRATVGSVACAVHARDKTAVEVAVEIAMAASARVPEQAKELPDLLREALERDDRGRFCVVIDAVDEAATAEQARLMMQTAIALAETCADVNVRVVVGSRRIDDAGDLLAPFDSALKIVDLDLPEFFAREDLVAYALATLQLVGAERANSPYRDTQVATAVATRIADMAHSNFLIAGLVARSHGLHDRQAVAVEQLRYTTTVRTALHAYLQRLPGVQGVSAQALLTALAYAESPGLTLALWRCVVQAMAGKEVEEQQLYRFARSAAANFLVESSDVSSPSGSFRLFHQALNEALRRPRAAIASAVDDERDIARALMQAADGQWAAAPGYVLRSLPGHAARGGIIDELLHDDAYPLHADLRRLVPAAKSAQSAAGRARARLLRKTPQALAAGPSERVALLSVTEAREQLGHAYRRREEAAAYRAVWAVGAPHAEDIVLEGHTGWINALCAVQVGQQTLLASASNDHTIRLWNIDTGETVRVLAGHTGPVRALAGCPGGGHALLASAGSDHTIRLWHPLTGTTVRLLPGHTAYINALCAVEAGQQTLLASASNDHTIRLWDPATGELVRVLAAHTGSVRALACCVSGGQTLLASAGADGTIRLWDPATGHNVRVLAAGDAWINALCPVRVGDEMLLASAGNDPALRLWNPATGELVRTITQHRDWVRTLASFAVAGRSVVASGGHDSVVRLWHSAPAPLAHDGFDGHTDWVTSLCVLTQGQQLLLASAGNDSAIRIWDVQAEPPQPSEGQVGAVTAVCALPTIHSTMVASAEGDSVVRVRDAASGAVVRELHGHDAWVRTLCLVEVDGRPHLAAGGDEGRIQLWDLTDEASVRTWVGHDDALTALRPVTVGGRMLLASASTDHTLRVWDPATSASRVTQVAWESPVVALDSVRVGKQQLLAVGLEDGSIGLWDPHRERTVGIWEGCTDAVTALTALPLPGRTLLASASDDRTISLWDIDTGQVIHRFEGHTDKVTTLATVTVGSRTQLVSASDDRTIRVWDPHTLHATMTVAVHSPAWALADCGAQVVAGLSDGLIALALGQGA